MMKFIVGVDADGVLTDMDKFNKVNGTKFFRKQPVNPNAYHVSDIFGVSKMCEIVYGLKYLNKYCTEVPPREYAKEIIIKLKDEGCELHEITARKFTASDSVVGKHYQNLFENWLEQQELDFKSIQYCSEHNSPLDKLIACHKLDVDVMIEDKDEVAIYLAEHGVKVILMDAPYNQGLKHENIIRVYNWKEVHENINILRKEKEASTNEISEFKELTIEEKENLSVEEKIAYLKSYKNHLKNNNIDKESQLSYQKKYKLYYKMSDLIVKIAFRPIVIDKKNIPYQKGVIFISNHLNSFDQFLMVQALGNRHITGLASSKIRHTLRGELFAKLGTKFVDRNDPQSRKESKEYLETVTVHGYDTMLFPEGTRKNKDSQGRKKIQNPFEHGAVSIAQKTGAPIVPLSINFGWFHSTVRVGEPIIIKYEDDLDVANQELEEVVLDMTMKTRNSGFQKILNKKYNPKI